MTRKLLLTLAFVIAFVAAARVGLARDKIPPAVKGTNPANGATGVSIGTTVTATFSEAVKNVTITTFRLSSGATPVSGTVTLNQATAIFTPSVPLAYGTTYTAKVTTGVTDLAGNPLPTNYSWIFSTASTPNTAPVANAGPDQSVTIGSLVTLDASASYDANAEMLAYIWSFSSKPAGSKAALSSFSAVRPTFTPDLAGAYVLSLVVSDSRLSSSADTVTITATTVAGQCTIREDGPQGYGIGFLPDGRIVTVGSDLVQGHLYLYNADISGGDMIASFSGADADVVVQPDGKIVIVGKRGDDVLVLRYDAGGALDPSFGAGGTAIWDGGFQESGYAVALQSDGKILVAGFSYDWVSDGDILLLRYNSNGTLDRSFGAGGVAIYDSGRMEFGGQKIALQADGKILVVGTVVGAAGTQDALLLRYNADGTMDGAFGMNGVVTYDGGGWDGGNAVTVQADGRIVVAGVRGTNNEGVVLLLRYNADGTLDPSFANGGVGIYGPSRALDVILQPDGRILVGGESILAGTLYNVALVARYNADGTPDLSFGDGGVIRYDGGYGADRVARLALAGDGSILAVGSSKIIWSPYGSTGNLLLMRLVGNCRP